MLVVFILLTRGTRLLTLTISIGQLLFRSTVKDAGNNMNACFQLVFWFFRFMPLWNKHLCSASRPHKVLVSVYSLYLRHDNVMPSTDREPATLWPQTRLFNHLSFAASFLAAPTIILATSRHCSHVFRSEYNLLFWHFKTTRLFGKVFEIPRTRRNPFASHDWQACRGLPTPDLDPRQWTMLQQQRMSSTDTPEAIKKKMIWNCIDFTLQRLFLFFFFFWIDKSIKRSQAISNYVGSKLWIILL